jgi:hypothetical protein
MTKELRSHLFELEVDVADYGEQWLISHGYQRKTPGEKAFAWMFWTAVAMLCGVCALTMWWVPA